MIELQRSLARKLDVLRVRIDVPDQDTVVLRHVPTHRRFYNKGATNTLIKRTAPGLPFLVCVDEDLEYLGNDPALSRAFASANRRSGWRTLALTQVGDDFQAAVEKVLAILGTDGQEPFLPVQGGHGPGAEGKTLLAVYGTSLSAAARGQAEQTVGREEEIDEVASCLLRWGQARLAVVVGESGVGKSNLLLAVAGRLLTCRPEWDLVSVDMAALVAGAMFEAEHEGLLARLLDETAALPQVALALEHIELAVGLPRGPLLLAAFLDRGRPLVGTILPEHLPRLQRECLPRHVHVLELAELGPEHTAHLLAVLLPKIAEHHRIEIDKSCILACVRGAGSLAGYLPAKAITLLDAAAARSSLAGAHVLAPDDICSMAGRLQES